MSTLWVVEKRDEETMEWDVFCNFNGDYSVHENKESAMYILDIAHNNNLRIVEYERKEI